MVAVGTTVVRALETAVDARRPGRRRAAGPTSCSARSGPARVVDGLITGLHAPEASHLRLLEAVAGRALVEGAYAEPCRSAATSGTSSATRCCCCPE